MRKEVIFALILGGLLGGVILFGINLANKAATQSTQTIEEEVETEAPQPTPNDLTIISPEDHAVVFDSTLKIIGSSKPGSTIVITSEEDDVIVDADEAGSFETEFELTGGQNIIQIAAFLEDSPIASAEIDIVYTTSKIE